MSTPTGPGGSQLDVSDALLAKVMRELTDAVIIADRAGTIVFWNAAAERVFGWPASSAVGQSLDLIVPERHRNAHWEGFEKVMHTGETRYATELLRVPALHADGERRSIAFTVSLLTATDGTVAGIAAVVRDETVRRAEEENLRRQLRELTANRESA
jgi:PAS domain S-box-containing protein